MSSLYDDARRRRNAGTGILQALSRVQDRPDVTFEAALDAYFGPLGGASDDPARVMAFEALARAQRECGESLTTQTTLGPCVEERLRVIADELLV